MFYTERERGKVQMELLYFSRHPINFDDERN